MAKVIIGLVSSGNQAPLTAVIATRAAMLAVGLLCGCSYQDEESSENTKPVHVTSLKEEVEAAVPLREAAFGSRARDDLLKRCAAAFPREEEKFDYCASRIPFDGDLN